MQQTPRGDEHELYQQLNSKLVNVICKHFHLSHDEARDVAQLAWLKFLERQPDRINVFGWLYTTGKFEVYARSRRGQREQPVDKTPESVYDQDLAAQLDRSEVTRLLHTTMRERLTDNQLAALTLWAQGYRYKQIARHLGKTYTWTNRHITEGLRALRQAMAHEPD